MIKSKSNKIVKCPKCGYEYLPAEIFVPKSFLGSPKYVVRKESGAIDFYDGESMNTHEEYICDNCGINFEIEADITFTSSYNEKLDFDDEYVSSVGSRIKLEEPQ